MFSLQEMIVANNFAGVTGGVLVARLARDIFGAGCTL